MIRVVVADDQALVRSGFSLILGSDPQIEVVAEARDGVEALAAVRRLKPDVVLMDIRMPGMDGIEATRHLTSGPATGDVRVLVLTTFDADEYVYEALRAGASGFLLKDTAPADLISAVQVVAGGDALLSPAITKRLIERYLDVGIPSSGNPNAGNPNAGISNAGISNAGISNAGISNAGILDVGQPAVPPPDAARPAVELPALTPRERDVLVAVARGLSNREIAEDLYLSYSTVKTHVSHLLAKLGVRDRAQLVMMAYQSGAIGLP